MKIGIIGTGRMGRGLAQAWVKAGNTVILGSRQRERARQTVAEISRKLRKSAGRPPLNRLPDEDGEGREDETTGGITGGTREEAAAAGVVVLAVPFKVAAGTVSRLADSLQGKLIIDITNPFGEAPEGRSGMSVNTGALEQPASWIAAFKTNFWTTLDQPVDPVTDLRRDCFLCGDDPDARQTVTGLVRQVGYRPVDCGGSENALVLDKMVPLMIALDHSDGTSRSGSWKYLEGKEG